MAAQVVLHLEENMGYYEPIGFEFSFRNLTETYFGGNLMTLRFDDVNGDGTTRRITQSVTTLSSPYYGVIRVCQVQ